MRKLYYLVAFPIDDGNEARTYGYHLFFGIFWTPVWVKCRNCLVELNCKDLRKFIDAKRANRHHETLEKSLRIFSFLVIDPQ
jgi:hypothetical protein